MSKLNIIIPPNEEIFQRVVPLLNPHEKEILFIYSLSGVLDQDVIIMGPNAWNRYHAFRIQMINKYWHVISKDISINQNIIVYDKSAPSHFPYPHRTANIFLQQEGDNNNPKWPQNNSDF